MKRQALALGALFGCTRPDAATDAATDLGGASPDAPDADTAEAAPRPREARVERLLGALRGRSLTTLEGIFSVVRLTGCCGSPLGCFLNNPTSPYARMDLPSATAGPTPTWRLRPDEAVVLVGRTPPPARYYGFTAYLLDRPGTPALEFASLGDTRNQLTLGTDPPDSPFGAWTALIFTADQSTERAVRAAAVEAGLPDGAVNTVALPEGDPRYGLRLGLDASRDSLAVLFRYAVPEDPESASRWFADPGFTVLRVTPGTEAHTPLPFPPVRPRATEPTERTPGLTAAQARLRDALVARYRARGLQVDDLPVDELTLDPLRCIPSGTACLGDNPDTIYLRSAPVQLTRDPTDFVVAYGLNHRATGRAVYSNAAVYEAPHLQGLRSVEDPQFPGEATVLLPGDPEAPGLYAWRFALDCGGADPHCTTIPEGCQGLEPDDPAFLAWRVYLDPRTRAGPASGTILWDGALHVHR
ncbi:MAG: hypothetical protein HY909_19530 [Deltaproteobacteria bacterium]|nr:hypothetical protein [Deltaproteobacteria bacterium]